MRSELSLTDSWNRCRSNTFAPVEFLLVIVVALAGAFLSFFSGFGLGTLLLPAFLLFFPTEVAIAATAVVHMLNNVFKLFLVGRYADKKIILGFGTLSLIGSIGGAYLLGKVIHNGDLFSYHLGGEIIHVKTIQFVIGILILIFAILEIAPWFNAIQLNRKILPIGGLISGFFGGLSGHQGALRSAFLMKAGLSKEAMMGTRVVCACLVDMSRITVYAAAIGSGWLQLNPVLIGVATLAAFTGAWFGNKWMKKTELPVINKVITISLMLFAIAMASGLMKAG